MTEINFKGKEFVYNHHLSVPHQPLEPNEKKSVGKVALDGNLIIQGDNLHALKSLLPLYAGKVDCIFIDPPYNTGNEGWSYNDKVNAPQIKEWLNDNPITVDDQLRHDKWCAMMWPRLRLLYELLADDGVIFICIDDNEVDALGQILKEIFGLDNFIATLPVVSNLKGNQDEFGFAGTHEYICVCSKNKQNARLGSFKVENPQDNGWQIDEFGFYKKGANLKATGQDAPRSERETLFFPIYVSSKNEIRLDMPNKMIGWEELYPITDGREMRWRWNLLKFKRQLCDVIVEREKDKISLYKKQRPTDGTEPEVKPKSVFYKPEYSSSSAMIQIKNILGGRKFGTPKPLRLVDDIVRIGTQKNSIILDSFAGSGTTAHAVLEANKHDGGNRKFILVEMEDHIADAVTAERVRRVINGYDFTGTKKTELLRKKLNATALKKGAELADEIEAYKAKQGDEYDMVKVEVKDSELVIVGENKIEKKMPGLGGSFTYYTLSAAVDIDAILTGNNLPNYQTLANVLFYIATNQTLKVGEMKPKEFYLGETKTAHVWMIYKPDLDWLKSPEAALTLSRAKEFVKKDKNKNHIVLAAANFVGREILKQENLLQVRYVPLPYALYQVVQD